MDKKSLHTYCCFSPTPVYVLIMMKERVRERERVSDSPIIQGRSEQMHALAEYSPKAKVANNCTYEPMRQYSSKNTIMTSFFLDKAVCISWKMGMTCMLITV